MITKGLLTFSVQFWSKWKPFNRCKNAQKRLTAPNMGMSQDEVEAILGSADNCGKTMGTMACTWGNEDSKHVKIVFMGDKAVTFTYDGLK